MKKNLFMITIMFLMIQLITGCSKYDASLDQTFVKDTNETIQVYKNAISNKLDLSKTDQTKISDYTVKYADSKKGLQSKVYSQMLQLLLLTPVYQSGIGQDDMEAVMNHKIAKIEDML